MNNHISNHLVKISFFAGVVYYITTYPVVFNIARKYFPIKFKQNNYILIFHAFVFSVLMYILTYFIFNPLVQIVEGVENNSDWCNGNCDRMINNTCIREIGCPSHDATSYCHSPNVWNKNNHTCNYDIRSPSPSTTTRSITYQCYDSGKTPILETDSEVVCK